MNSKTNIIANNITMADPKETVYIIDPENGRPITANRIGHQMDDRGEAVAYLVISRNRLIITNVVYKEKDEAWSVAFARLENQLAEAKKD